MKSVLLVDDDSVCNFINKKTLQMTGRVGRIDTALNGLQAIAMVRDQYLRVGQNALPDLILLDLNMPVMDGFDFLKEFNTLPFGDRSKVKIVVVTSSANESDIKRAQGLGIHTYLNKPLNAHAAIEACEP